MEENTEPKSLGLKKSSESHDEPKSLGLKKKVVTEVTPSTSPSVSEGGTSGLTATPSVSVNTPTETYGVKPGTAFDPFAIAPEQAAQKTVLGNKLPPSKDIKPVTTVTGGMSVAADSKIIKNEAKITQDYDTKSMIGNYEKYKASRSQENPLALDDNKNTMDFYLHNLKNTNPDEYNVVTQKQAHLSEKGDKLEEQKYHAELINKALALKTRVMSGKTDIASNALRDNYGDVIRNLNDNSEKFKQTEIKLQDIDNVIKNNYEVDENNQIITTPTNRKEVEDLLSKRSELIKEYEGYAKSLNDIRENKDFVDALTLLDETQKSYDSLESVYKEVREGNPEAFNKLPAYKEQLKKEQEAQFHKDVTEQMTGGTLGVNEATGRGGTSVLTSLSFIPKTFGDDSNYGWTDKLYDSVKSSVDEFDAENQPLPTGYDKPVYENGQWNLQYLPGKVAGTITEMAPIIAITAATEGATAGLLARLGSSGELSTTLGSFAGEYVSVADDMYNEAKASGMSEKDAMSFSRSAATVQAVIGPLSPDIKLARNNAFKEGISEYASQVAKGVSKKEALKDATKGFAEKLMKEVPQENLQTIAEIADKNNMYEKMGLTDKIQGDVKKDMIETTILSSIVTLGLGGGAVKTPSRMQQESLYMAASQPEEIMKAAQNLLNAGKITQEQFNDATMKVAKASFALSKMDKALPAEKKIKMLVPLMEKLDLKEEAANLDDSQKELMNEKISKKDAEIKHIATQLSDEEIQNEQEEADYLNSIKEQHAKEQAVKTVKETIPAEENKMQKEGLFEVDKTQQSQPIELYTKPENVITTPGEIVQEPVAETKSVEDKVSELEKAIKENKQNFFNEKIDHPTYRKNNDALEADLLKLQTPQEKTTENDNKDITGVQSSVGVGEKSIEIKPNEETSSEQTTTSGVLQTQGQETKQQEVKTPTQISAAQEMVEDNESDTEEIPKSIRNAKTEADKAKAEAARKAFVNKMDLDKEAFKLINEDTYQGKSKSELKDLVDKKYMGTLERAYKAKVDGVITGPEYTKYRNELNDIVTGKLSEYGKKEKTTGGQEGESLRKGELKAQVSALGEKVKEKLLGQGFNNIALSSLGPVSPKTVESAINLAVKGIHLGIDLGYGVREATDRALTAIKNHPKYKQLISEGLNEKEFKKAVEGEFSKAKSEAPKVEKSVEKTTESNKENQQGQVKEENKGQEKTSESNKKESFKEKVPDVETGRTKKMVHFERIDSNEKYKDIVSLLDNGDYSEKSIKKIEKYADDLVNEYEKSGNLMDLAYQLTKPEYESMLHELVIDPVRIKIVERLNNIAQSDSINEMEKSSINDLAAELYVVVKDNQNMDATKTKITGEIAKKVFDEISANPKITEKVVEKKVQKLQEKNLSKKQKSNVKEVYKEINATLENETETKESTPKKKKRVLDKSKFSDFLNSLKTDISEC